MKTLGALAVLLFTSLTGCAQALPVLKQMAIAYQDTHATCEDACRNMWACGMMQMDQCVPACEQSGVTDKEDGHKILADISRATCDELAENAKKKADDKSE
jgi:hypothetical protein